MNKVQPSRVLWQPCENFCCSKKITQENCFSRKTSVFTKINLKKAISIDELLKTEKIFFTK